MSWQANVRWPMEFCNIPRTVAQTMMHVYVQQICALFGGNYIQECVFPLLSVSFERNEIWLDILGKSKGWIQDFRIKEEC